MNTEYEATFENVDKENMRNRLQQAGASLLKPEFLQKRVVFHLPEGHRIPGSWARVRDEADKITMSIKVVDGTNIEDQKEVLLKIDNFEQGAALLRTLGCAEKAYQESRRELWELDGTEVTIDEWPFLSPFVEIEGRSEAEVKAAALKLGFDWSTALFCAVATLYNRQYGLSESAINDETPKIVFDMANPFLNRS